MKLSIVLAISDNFDIDNNSIEQLNITLNNIFKFSTNEMINLEVIITNWNNITEKKTYEKLDLSNKPDHVVIRYIEVGNDIHKQYNLSHKIPFYEAHAINIGIRRATSNVILKLEKGTFFTKGTWLNILEYLNKEQYKESFLTLSTYSKLDKSILNKNNDTYNIEKIYITKFCIEKLEDNKLIDYYKKRIYQKENNIKQLFRAFNVLLFSKELASELRGFPELSVYPDIFVENIFIENMKKSSKQHLIKSAGYKIYYKEKDRINPMNDDELKLATDTDKIIINRIKKEYNPVLFNDENWGLRYVNLKIKIL